MIMIPELIKQKINVKALVVSILMVILVIIFISPIFFSKDSSAPSLRIPKKAQNIGGGFYKYEKGIWGESGSKGNFVFASTYESFKLEGVNVDAFVPLGDVCRWYGKDDTHVFYKSKIIKDADIKSFNCLHDNGINTAYAKDLHSVYYNGVMISQADPKTFEEFSYSDKVDPSEISYAKDKTRVYFNGSEILSADLSSFELIPSSKRGIYRGVIHSLYAKDSQGVYVNGIKIDFADPKSFQIIDGSYAKDFNHVWWHINKMDVLIDKADPLTFEIFKHNFSKDLNYVYYEGKLVNIDARSFSAVPSLESGLFFKDKTSIYCSVDNGDNHYPFKIDGADPETFTILNYVYAKDKKHIFYISCDSHSGPFVHVLENADISTFEVIDETHAKDKNNQYLKDKPMTLLEKINND